MSLDGDGLLYFGFVTKINKGCAIPGGSYSPIR